ncbi:hypothetical protein [Stieleria maiorica]|nr:hypothetical protein [Stieleria maiorica]
MAGKTDRRVPDFISKGTFSWGGLDYHFAGGQDPEIRDFAMDDPWRVLLKSLARAKRGDFSELSHLEKVIVESKNTVATNIALELIGSAGTDAQLKFLRESILHGNEYLSVEACAAAVSAGCLSLIPAMLERWAFAKAFRDRETISLRLGILLEEWEGPITEMRLFHDDSDGSTTEEIATESVLSEGFTKKYVALVNNSMVELKSRCAASDSPVLLGNPFGVVKLAEYMASLLRSEIDFASLSAMFLVLRHRFDSSTGIDCSGFFLDRKFQPLMASSVLETFFESGEADKFEHGVRYFFGHRIPK